MLISDMMRRRVNLRWRNTVKMRPERPLYNRQARLASVRNYVHQIDLAGDLSTQRLKSGPQCF